MLILNLLWTKDSYNWLNPFMINNQIQINKPNTFIKIHMICCSQSFRSIQNAIQLRKYYNMIDPIYIIPYVNEIGSEPEIYSEDYMKKHNLKPIKQPANSSFDKYVIPMLKNILWYNNNIGLELIKSKVEPVYEFNIMIISHTNIIKKRYDMEISNGQAYIHKLTYYKIANQTPDDTARYYDSKLQIPYVSYINKVY